MTGNDYSPRKSRPLLHPERISSFGLHHWGQRRAYCSTTDIDLFARDGTGVYLIGEHRTGGYIGCDDDNIGAVMLKRACHQVGMVYAQVSEVYHILSHCRFPVGRARDSRDILWMDYTADRPRGLYLITGNTSRRSDFSEFWCQDAEDITALKELAERLNISFRIINVNNPGIPSERDREWLRSLTYMT